MLAAMKTLLLPVVALAGAGGLLALAGPASAATPTSRAVAYVGIRLAPDGPPIRLWVLVPEGPPIRLLIGGDATAVTPPPVEGPA
jgi:hypothetical protein